ncbi:hypothetical protein ACIBG0_39640 [Nocardia sp. NPDC050630]|uniref:hypothetical protein n=1 Tax=Nocardia sp. NPDC050630 TaxID=3364321 RepID=UPI0037ACDE03
MESKHRRTEERLHEVLHVRESRGLSALCGDSAHHWQRGLIKFEVLGLRRVPPHRCAGIRSDFFVAQVQQKELITLQC